VDRIGQGDPIFGTVTIQFDQAICNIVAWSQQCDGSYITNRQKDFSGSMTFSENCGFIVWGPKKSGVIKVIATVVGACPTSGPTDNGGSVSHTWTTTGSLKVKVPPEGESCSSCGSGQLASFGTGYPIVSSVDFQLNLGRAAPEHDAGYILLHADDPTNTMAQPSGLQVPFDIAEVEVLTNNDGVISQVKTPQGLVQVVTNNAYKYQLQCFYEENVAKDGSGNYVKDGSGFYTTNGAAAVTWVVQNPDTNAAQNRLWITEDRDGETRDFKYNYTSTDERWDLVQPDGLTTNSVWKVADTNDATITNIFRQVSYGGMVVQKKQETYQYIAARGDAVLTREVEGDGAVTRTNTYTYYPTNAAAGSANQLQRADYANGNWEYYVYDDIGRVITNYSAYANNAPPTAGTEPVPVTDNCKVTAYAYSLTSGEDGIEDDGSVLDFIPRKTVISLPASGTLHEVSRSYRNIYDEENETDQQVRNPGDTWGATDSLSTYTLSDTQGRVVYTQAPDYSTTAYTYSTDLQSTIIEHYGADDVLTTNLVDELGLPLTNTTAVVVGGNMMVLSQEIYNYKDGGGDYLDPLRRSYDMTDLAGRITQYRYSSCCGLDYIINPDGAKTYYLQDSLLKRPIGASRVVDVVGAVERTIQTTNKLNAVGAVLETKRSGTNGSVIILVGNQYDVLGRTVSSTNALGGVTTNLYLTTDSRLQEVVVYPDGGTRTNTYYRDGNLESVTGTAANGVKYVYGIEQDGSYWRRYTKEIKLDASGAETSEWTKTYQDGIGRSYKTVYPTNATSVVASETFYDSSGRVKKQVDPDGVATLYEYSYDRLLSTTVDLNHDDAKYYGDRVTETQTSCVEATGGKPDLIRTDTIVWMDDYSQRTVARNEVSADGLKSWSTVYPDGTDLNSEVTRSTETQLATSGNSWARTVTASAPDGSATVTVYRKGQLESVTQYSAAPSQLGQTTYSYDPHGRQYVVTDARNGATYYGYNNADQVATVTTPSPGTPGSSPQTTWMYYDKLERLTNSVNADGGSVVRVYDTKGQITRTYGSLTYPVAYSYDYAGRMKTMTNWTAFSAAGSSTGARVTTWNYDAYRGLLSSKRYPDATTGNAGTVGPDYTYTAGGRLKTRAWARLGTGSQRITTTYSYGFDDGTSGNEHGDLTGISYANDPNGTPDVTYTYDARGRRIDTAQTGGMDTAVLYDDANELLSEAYTGGQLDGLWVTNAYDTLLHRTKVMMYNNSTPLLTNSYSYDADSGRLTSVSHGDASVTYSYLANSPLVEELVFKQGATTRLTTTRDYDYLNRLTDVENTVGGAAVASAAYQLNALNQRERVTEADGSYWRYEYDSLGQVKAGKKYWSDGTPVAGQQFGYTHDNIGNRTATQAGGDENGANLRSATYSANALNQYTSRTVPGAVDVMGLALATNAVTVNSQSAYRKGEYFRKELSVGNSNAAVWQSISVAAVGETTQTGNAFVPKTPEAFSYDADGNLTNDGRWVYTWDAENRLVQQVSQASAPSGSKYRLNFAYDATGRRIQKLVSTNDGSGYVAQSTNRFVYDGWNVLGTLAPDTTLLAAYTWGPDLSGTMQGAGGVCGLLEVCRYGAATTNCFAAFDGNGNVVALVNASDGTVSAQYEYGPFGEVLRATGSMARANPFRFSTKYLDSETDLLYYGYRFYDPSTGRWLSRDPASEKGGLNLYGFVKNSPSLFADPDGRIPILIPIIIGGVILAVVTTSCQAKRPCCVVSWTILKDGVQNGGYCYYIAHFHSATPVGNPGCCPNTTTWQKETVTTVGIKGGCSPPGTAAGTVRSVWMYKGDDSPTGPYF
jgi:RHS repeat-associated protein